MKLLMFALVVFGATNIVVYGIILEPLRSLFKRLPLPFKLNLFLTCPTCVGFWAGIAIAYLSRFSTLEILAARNFLDYLFLGIVGSATSFLLQAMVEGLEARRMTDEDLQRGLD